MIIQIRGTSGSGKTWAMRLIQGGWGTWQPRYVSDNAHNSPVLERFESRKKPVWYQCGWGDRWTFVLGHYEATCGGCDNIGSAGKVWELTSYLRQTHPGCVILQEGLLLSEDVKWTCQMPGAKVFFLTTPLEKCLEQIGSRRAAAGNEKPLDPKNTTNRYATIDRARRKLIEMGVSCRRASAPQAVDLIIKLLRNPC